jgi:hypothetical protein
MEIVGTENASNVMAIAKHVLEPATENVQHVQTANT